MATVGKPAKFARVWRGRTSRSKADAYQAYWLQAGITPLRAKGALDVEMFRSIGKRTLSS